MKHFIFGAIHDLRGSSDSLSSHLDWNDGSEIIKYCAKQKKIQEVKDFRPSEYFGAVQVE